MVRNLLLAAIQNALGILCVIALMVFAAVSTPNVTFVNVLTNTYHNAPFVISGYYSVIRL